MFNLKGPSLPQWLRAESKPQMRRVHSICTALDSLEEGWNATFTANTGVMTANTDEGQDTIFMSGKANKCSRVVLDTALGSKLAHIKFSIPGKRNTSCQTHLSQSAHCLQNS